MIQTKKSSKKKTEKVNSSLKNLVEKYFKKNAIENSPIAVACSGGLDSTALLDCISGFYPSKLIICVHVDHNVRKDSHLAVDFLQKFCKAKKINFKYKTLKKGVSDDENSLRQERYKVFEQICNKLKITNLFIAHNLNDDAETILFRIFRGTSSFGLTGIQPNRKTSSGIQIHRPFLDTNRKLIAQYAELMSLDYVDDSSNQNSKYARNLIRNEIIPLCEKINPNIIENIHNLSNIVGEEQNLITQLVDKAVFELGTLPWDLNKFREYPRIIQRQLIIRFFTPNIRFCNEFLSAIETGGFHKINYEKDKFFVVKQKKIYFA